MNIKRKMAFILALALCTSSMTAFAETSNGTSPANIEVKGKFVAASGGGTVIAADVTWDDMTFTYQDGDEVWNPDTHAYEVTDGGWTNETKNINITNHSNTGLLIYTDYDAEYEDVDFSIDKDIVSLPTAEGTAPADAPKATIKIGVSGEAIQEDEKLGSIFVSIYENYADLISVSTAEELKAAVQKGGNIVLSNASAIYATGGTDFKNVDIYFESDNNYGLLIDNAKVAVIDSTFTGKGLNGANIGLKDLLGSLTFKRNITIYSGIYNFDPTEFVDTDKYDVRKYTEGWFVTEK